MSLVGSGNLGLEEAFRVLSIFVLDLGAAIAPAHRPLAIAPVCRWRSDACLVASVTLARKPLTGSAKRSFVTVAGWSAHKTTARRPASAFGHARSLSSILRSSSKSPRPSSMHTSVSAADLPIMTLDPAPPASSNPTTPVGRRSYSPQPPTDDENDLSTIPDPRSRDMSPASFDLRPAGSPHHPDLDEEVATLSTKLVNAINHQTSLDDTLSATRLELERSHERVRQLEVQVEEQLAMLAGDVWVKRKLVETERTKLLGRVAEEKRHRQEVEQQKRKIEAELENLTTALFEEANKMVISAKEEARIERETLHRRNDQLRAQLADTEGLLLSQQEQLAELKQVIEHMSSECHDQTNAVPSSPSFGKFDAREVEGRIDGQAAGMSEPPSPSYPTSFTHLLRPVLRTDLAAFGDFRDLIHTSKRLSAAMHAQHQQQQQRMSSGGASTLSALAAGLGSASSQSTVQTATASTTVSPPMGSPQSPNTPGSTGSAMGSPAPPQLILPSLRETKFYKRALVEDIEPTLRLDAAPGLSWLARRSVLTAVTEGSLLVEPAPAAITSTFGRVIKPELYACALCGENRKAPQDEQYLRRHRFRTSEAANASQQRGWYPLCRYCLNRLRSTCDFLAFLRIVKDGHWRAEGDDAVKAAWEESVRLREQMFWNRIGGGVVPMPGAAQHSNRASTSPSSRVSHEGEEAVSTHSTGDDGKEKVALQPISTAGTSDGPEMTSRVVDGPDDHEAAMQPGLDETDQERIKAAVDSTPSRPQEQGLGLLRPDSGDGHSTYSTESFYPDPDADKKDGMRPLSVTIRAVASVQ